MNQLSNSKPVYVLGLCYSHDASACLLRDGKPLVAIQQERLSRVKHDGNIAEIDLQDCIQYCLNVAKIHLNDIELIVENSPTFLFCKERNHILGFPQRRFLDNYHGRIVQVSHHLAHAYSAYGASPYSDCIAVVLDGQGNFYEDITESLEEAEVFPKQVEQSYIERESIYFFSQGRYTVLRKNLSPAHKSFLRIGGLGHLYEVVSSYVFQSRFDAGKLMGLSAYGKASRSPKILDITGENAEFHFDLSLTTRSHIRPNRTSGDLKRNFSAYADLAARTQCDLERGTLALCAWASKKARSENLVLSGGVALNCSSNSKIQKKSGFKNVFIVPPASDCGVSLGCAYFGYLSVLGHKKKPLQYTDYLGRSYTGRAILAALRTHRTSIQFSKETNICKSVANLLDVGKVVGWFQGGSEFGPRALGNRSILADPRRKNLFQRINLNIKKRELFRPLAPSVLAEQSAAYFGTQHSPYMLLAHSVALKKRNTIPAVVHADGSARPQTVDRDMNPKFYALIKEFFRITGVPLLLNTSFNTNEPIVETPADAIKCLLASGIDALAIGDYLVLPQKLRK